MPQHQTTKSPHADLIERANASLRAAGLRVTNARLDVLAMLLQQQRAMSHTEMQEALPVIDRVTLYRALDCLVEAGLAHKIVGDDRITRFRSGAAHVETLGAKGRAQHQHGHFQCLECAKVFCLEQAPITALVQSQLVASLRPGFSAQGIELTIKGYCDLCNHSR
ncbi:MAG: transcriptional repressor [Burkholderiaceae bacterium]|nr:MAG: transcriptional repressor [Burkholderiaceae bacterium]